MYVPGEYYLIEDIELDNDNYETAPFLCSYIGEDTDGGWEVFSILYNNEGKESKYLYDGFKDETDKITPAPEELISKFVSMVGKYYQG